MIISINILAVALVLYFNWEILTVHFNTTGSTSALGGAYIILIYLALELLTTILYLIYLNSIKVRWYDKVLCALVSPLFSILLLLIVSNF